MAVSPGVRVVPFVNGWMNGGSRRPAARFGKLELVCFVFTRDRRGQGVRGRAERERETERGESVVCAW